MQIGSMTLELIEPDELDAQLIATTGCSAREVREHLAGAAIAGHVAAALAPFVNLAGESGPPPRIALAEEIVAEGVAQVRGLVLELYDKHLGIAPQPVPEHLVGLVEQAGSTPPEPTSLKPKGKTSGKIKG